jgi:hypothetical protein
VEFSMNVLSLRQAADAGQVSVLKGLLPAMANA